VRDNHEGAKPRKQKLLRAMDSQVEFVSQVYYESLSCPRALTAALLLRYGEYAQLAALRAIPSDYVNSDDYFKAACASDWLRKYPGLPGFDDDLRQEAAEKSFVLSESECAQTNQRLRDLSPDSELSYLLDVAAEWFADLMGPFPCDLSPRFGPGATVSDPATATTVLDKVCSLPTMTKGCEPLLTLWRGTLWERSHNQLVVSEGRPYSPEVVEGNVFFCVPKEATTFRGCCKEASINVSYQLPIGRAIRRNLKRNFAYDIDSRADLHRLKAREGSATGRIATIDSMRASDTMAYQLVQAVASRAGLWFELLDTVRAPQTLFKGQWVRLEKFSSMGNGCTFELETVLFLSLALAIATVRGEDALELLRVGDISVFGDDIIVPTSMAAEVVNLLGACGFTVNSRKSYLDGEFRESCGGDFFNGMGVNTPKLRKDDLQVADWFSLHNLVKARVADRYPPWSLEGRTWRRFLSCVKDQFPRRFRSMYGPRWLGDQVLHGWYGPQIRASARRVAELTGPVRPGESHHITDANQWVGRLEVLVPKIFFADVDVYPTTAQLAYLLYSWRSEGPARRPVRKLRYTVQTREFDYHILFLDEPPKLPWWITQSPYARYFGTDKL